MCDIAGRGGNCSTELDLHSSCYPECDTGYFLTQPTSCELDETKRPAVFKVSKGSCACDELGSVNACNTLAQCKAGEQTGDSDANYVGCDPGTCCILSHKDIQAQMSSPQTFAGLQKVTLLVLSNNGMEQIDEGVLTLLQDLKRFMADSNLLKSVPLDISKLTSLVELDLNKNRISDVPPQSFHRLLSLEIMNLHSNALEQLPAELFSNLQSLKALDLSHNQLSEVPTVGNPPGLETLFLNHNGLVQLRDNAFAGMAGLGILTLSSNSIESPLARPLFDDLASLVELDVSNNRISGLGGKVLGNLASLEKLTMKNNGIAVILPGSFNGLSALKYVSLASNNISTIPRDTFTAKALRRLDDAGIGNETRRLETTGEAARSTPRVLSVLGISPPVKLKKLLLPENHISYVPSDAFAGLALEYLSLRSQSLPPGTLLDIAGGAFRHCCAPKSTILLSQNTILRLRSHTFEGLNNSELQLSNLGIEVVEDGAFSGTSDLSIDLQRNNVRQMSAESFPVGFSGASNCTDFPDYTIAITSPGASGENAAGPVRQCDSVLRKVSQSNDGLWFADQRGSAGFTVLDACCAFKGGHPHGTALMMDEFSDILCTSASVTGGYNITLGATTPPSVRCQCGCFGCRYDLDSSMCKQTCSTGQKWDAAVAGDPRLAGVVEAQITSNGKGAGVCADCPPGTHSDAGAGANEWPEVCIFCEAGRFGPQQGASACEACPTAKYMAGNMATVCDSCGWGMIAEQDEGSRLCTACDFAHTGSEDCDFPVMALLVTLAALVLLCCLGRVGLKAYRESVCL